MEMNIDKNYQNVLKEIEATKRNGSGDLSQ